MSAHVRRGMAAAALVLGTGCAGLMTPAPTPVADPPRPRPPTEPLFAQVRLGSIASFVRCTEPDCLRPTPKTLALEPAARPSPTALPAQPKAAPGEPHPVPVTTDFPVTPAGQPSAPRPIANPDTAPLPAPLPTAAVARPRPSTSNTVGPSNPLSTALQSPTPRIPSDPGPTVTIFFGRGSALLSPSDRVRLDEAVRLQGPIERISLSAQTTGNAGKPANQALAHARAAAVHAHLAVRDTRNASRIRFVADPPCCRPPPDSPSDDPARRRVDVWFHAAQPQY